MASHEERNPGERRRRDSTTHRKHHERRKSREPDTARASQDRRNRSKQKQKLSPDALAQLNDTNAREQVPESSRPRKPRKKRRSEQPERGNYEIVDVEPGLPPRQRTRHYETGDSDGGYDSQREARRRQNKKSEAEREVESPRRTSRPRGYVAADADNEDEDEQAQIERKNRRPRRKKRLVSGAIVEEGRATSKMRGGKKSKHSSYDSLGQEKAAHGDPPSGGKKKKKWIIVGVCLLLLIIIIVAAVVGSKNSSSKSSNHTGPSNIDPFSGPTGARGTYLDPFTWYDTTDFNVTYTNDTVGDLPVMGLFTKWDDSAAANSKVPALDKPWGDYATKPARGVNLGGWLSIEPFIAPSLFNYDSRMNIIDEWSLCRHLGPQMAASTIEKHYATFVTEQTFKEIRDAGLDHVRIPYSYWAVQTYDDDPYVFRTSWRYLLRGIEWARKYGLRVNLDLHALPGSQNGWNHSGRQGAIGWLMGPNGDLNRQRSIDVHDRLSKFFAQDRYKNIVAFYGLANEPQMLQLDTSAVTAWSEQVFKLVRNNGLTWPKVVFGDGFMGLDNWQGLMTGFPDMILDVHQYVIFDNGLIGLSHQDKVNYACANWTQQAEGSLNTATGYGPTMFAEWSQADTDCAQYLTNVGWGNRWTGTYNSGNPSTEALTPRCPTVDASCTCDNTNDNFSKTYKQFLLMFAEAQMTSFEKGYGWWYWTWDTESASQWSYRQGLAAGILPAKAHDRDFNCDSDVPDFSNMGLPESY
ncbi:glycoside hydrolase family 5 protein [Xylaria nigripes]|nr:glycoside hydrolase family 5 protein [Xylaria nigripes]